MADAIKPNKGANMNPTVKLILTTLRLFQRFSPSIIAGIGGLIAAIEGKAAAGPVSLLDVHNLADEHKVDVNKVADFVGNDLTPKGE